MNYRHIYHAGGLADIVKHLTLLHLLKRMVEKPAAFCAIDSHAAIGLYDLNAGEAQKTGEAQSGAFGFCRLPPHPLLQPLQAMLIKHNPGLRLGLEFDATALKTYPGSPVLIHHYLRLEDRLVAIEKHPEDAGGLKGLLGHEARVNIHMRDAWEGMAALIPPHEKRLLVFIDPPYEKPDEMTQAFAAIEKAYMRMPHAIFALWYPIKDIISVARLQEKFEASAMQKIMRCDVFFGRDILPDTMNGCGMVIINPPYQLDATLQEAMALLRPLFEAGTPEAQVEWIKEG